MENKENYVVKLTSNNLNLYDISYVTSSNVISVEDINNLANNINYCIDGLNNICTDLFCLFCLNTIDYYVDLTDKLLPRVKYFNNNTTSISAVLADSMINDIPLSSSITTPINLITLTKDNPFLYVRSINNNTGDLSGIESITINDQTFTYTKENKGIVNLGNYRRLSSYLSSINGQSGNLTLPMGVTYNNVNYFCDALGNVNLTNVFDKFIVSSNLMKFDKLYIEEVNEDIASSVINLKYLKNNTLGCSAFTVDVGVANTMSTSVPMMDLNFLSFIYAISSNTNVDITGVISKIDPTLYLRNYFEKGIPLTFIATYADANTKITLISNTHSDGLPNIKYSKNFQPYETFNESILLIKGLIISFSGSNDTFSRNENSYYTINISKPVYCYGNIMSLVNWANNILNDYQFYSLFKDCTNLLTPPLLPAMKLKSNCYKAMFSGCTNLVKPPILPATGLASSCYLAMFKNCSKLSAFPILPATEMKECCYKYMFSNCSKLTIAPYYLLPAEVTATCCYYAMFDNCANLTDSPLLNNCPSTCYKGIFNGCSSLSAIHVNMSLDDLNSIPSTNWINYHNTNAIIYNTEAWNFMLQKAENSEYFYYKNNSSNDNNRISTLPTSFKIARSLEDTPISFELIDGKTSAGFCFRSLQYKVSTNTYKSHYFKKNLRDIVNNMNVHFKYYDRDNRISGNNRDENGWIKQIWDRDDNNIEMYDNGYTLCHNNYPFNNTTSAKNGLIISLSSNYMSQGFVDNDTIIFWRLCHQIKSCKFKIMGNINSLIGGRDYVRPFLFFSLFSNLKCGNNHYTEGFIDAHQLILPANEIYEGAYAKMFEGCTGLKGIPTTLPIRLSAPSCCMDMFKGCTALKTTSLQLSTNRMTDLCYANMFNGCTNLVIAPTFNSISAAPSCCINMFKLCSNLYYCQDLITHSINVNSYDSMFKNCSSLIIPPSLDSKTINVGGCKDMFAGCNNLAYFPPLPMTTIGANCYYNMFQVCSSTISPYVYLPAEKLELNCYYNMFNQTKVQHLVVKFTDWNDEGNNSTYVWLSNVPNTGSITCDYLKDIRNSSHIPTNWTLNNSKEVIVKFGENVNNKIKLIYLRK